MKILSWNVNGLRSVVSKNLLEPVITLLNPDIVCLQETKTEPNQIKVDLPNYSEFWNSSKTKKGYAGTAILSKPQPLSITSNFPNNIVSNFNLSDSYGNTNEEGRIISAEYQDYYLVNVYTPNAKRDLSRLHLRHQDWDPAFLQYIKQLASHKPVIFCGDLNVAHREIDLANPKSNRGKHGFTEEERSGIDNMITEGFCDTFRLFNQQPGCYTWWSQFAQARSRNVGWRIDYFFTSIALVPHLRSSEIHPHLLGSDHCPVTLEI